MDIKTLNHATVKGTNGRVAKVEHKKSISNLLIGLEFLINVCNIMKMCSKLISLITKMQMVKGMFGFLLWYTIK